jgi:hypothetical protein
MNHGTKQIVAVLFVLFFCVYSVSPLHYVEVTEVENTSPCNRSEHQHTSPRLFLLQVFLSHVLGAAEEVDMPSSVGVLAKRRKAIVSPQSLAGLGRIEQSQLSAHAAPENRHGSMSIEHHESPVNPLKGFHLLASGLSPPC